METTEKTLDGAIEDLAAELVDLYSAMQEGEPSEGDMVEYQNEMRNASEQIAREYHVGVGYVDHLLKVKMNKKCREQFVERFLK